VGKALLVVLCLAGTGTALGATAKLSGWGDASSEPAAAASPTPTEAYGHTSAPAVPDPNAAPNASSSTASAHPVSVAIPAIHVSTTLQDLGLMADGVLSPPTNFTQAGWYTGSPVPGSPGPSVIAGHVDSTSGPAVFFALRELKAGDAVSVGLSDGSTVTFKVVTVQSYAKDAFPTAMVYGARPDPELRLITCGGAFTGGHYVDDVVVYATLA
jgi:LPXTG-site transpeptidase (sortase) family protein